MDFGMQKVVVSHPLLAFSLVIIAVLLEFGVVVFFSPNQPTKTTNEIENASIRIIRSQQRHEQSRSSQFYRQR